MIENTQDLVEKRLGQQHICKYCGKEFRKESSLAVHLCEPKRRWQQEKEVGVQLGMQAYLRFYEMTQGSAKMKTYADFVVSGVFLQFSRDELKLEIEKNGGKVKSSISAKTSYVVAGDKMGPSKRVKAGNLGITILSEDEFLSMIS